MVFIHFPHTPVPIKESGGEGDSIPNWLVLLHGVSGFDVIYCRRIPGRDRSNRGGYLPERHLSDAGEVARAEVEEFYRRRHL